MYSQRRLAEAGLLDFKNFLAVIWEHLNLPVPTSVQLDMADYLHNGPRRLVLEAFRGVGKSWITAAFVAWQLLLDPQLKIMVVSANKDRANDFSIFVKRLIDEVPILQHLKPHSEQRRSNISFDVGPAQADQSPSVKSVGITGQLTGSRANIIICDDGEVPKNSYTHTQRMRLLELIREFEAVVKPGGRICYLGTPQTEASIYNELPSRGYELRVWPAQVPNDPDAYHGRLAPFVMDMIERGIPALTPVDPKRFDEEDLEERLASYAPAGYALQFMLDTNPSDISKHPLKLSDLIVHEIDEEVANAKLVWGRTRNDQRSTVIEDLGAVGFTGDAYRSPSWISTEMAPFTGSVMFIDPSGRGKDDTSYAVVKHLHGMLFLTDVGGFVEGYSETTMKALCVAAVRGKVNHVIVEQNFGDGMFVELLKPHLHKVHPCQIEEVHHHNQKEIRIIDTLHPILQQHRLVVDRQIIEKDLELCHDGRLLKALFYQMTRLTIDRGSLPHDDKIEAVAGAVNYWVTSMSRDTEKALEDYREQLLDEELKKFHESAVQIGRNKPSLNPNKGKWISV